MATWEHTAFKVYNNGGNSQSAGDGTGSLSDGSTPNNLFDTTETITGGQDGFMSTDDNGTFIGTIEVLGVTWVGIIANSGKTIFYATVPAGTTSPQINTAFTAATGGTNKVGDLTLSNTGGFTTCFAAGTRIATPAGETAVESLAIGDLILTSDGRVVPVKWVGRQTLHRFFTPAGRFEPVRVTAGALGGGLPHSDLVLTSDHALILDGLAVNAGALVNGTTITRVPAVDLPERVTYYHIETAAHDAILANGAAAETFVDYVGRAVFDNHAEYLALYGSEPAIAEMYLPRVSSRRQLPESLRSRFGIADFGADVDADVETFLAARQVA